MNEQIEYFSLWIVVIVFLVFPPFLVRQFVIVAPVIRVVVYCLLIAELTSLGLCLALRRGDIVAEMPIGNELNTEKSNRIAAAMFRRLAALIVIAGMFMLVNIAPSIAF